MSYSLHRRLRPTLGAPTAWAVTLAISSLVLVTGLGVPGAAGANPASHAAPGQLMALERTSSATVPGRILVKRKPGVSDDRLQQVIGAQGGRAVGRIAQIDVHEIQVPEHAVARVVAALERNPAIEFAHPDYLEELLSVVPDDPRYGRAWHLPNIDAPTAWTMTQGDGMVVAILDTGIESTHPDFAGKLVQGWNATSPSDLTIDPDDTSDVNGHGTRVAGTVGAATNNGTGVAAVGWNARIMPIRVTNRSDGVASSSDMARGLTWAADNGAHVANMSYQSWRHSTVQSAARYFRGKGGVVFGSAGNSGSDAGLSPTPDVIVVTATGTNDSHASWADYGAYVDLAAPGDYIETTRDNASYGQVRGTSFSSPIAAAVGALVMSANPQLTPDQVQQILFDSAADLGAAGWDPYYGWGRINAANAVSMAWSQETDRESPVVAFVSPDPGATVEGVVQVKVSAEDNVKVTRIDLYADGIKIGSADAAPAEFSWDSSSTTSGATVWLRAEAFDSAGNTPGTDTVEVIVEHATTEPEPPPAPAPAPAPAPDPEPAPALTLTSTSINEGRAWTAIVTLNGPASAATAGSWDFGRNNVGGCTIASGSTSCSFSLSGIRKNIGAVTYTDPANKLSVTVGKP